MHADEHSQPETVIEMTLCPYCKKWVQLEDHEHEQRIREFRARIARVRAKLSLPTEVTRALCRLVPVQRKDAP